MYSIDLISAQILERPILICLRCLNKVDFIVTNEFFNVFFRSQVVVVLVSQTSEEFVFWVFRHAQIDLLVALVLISHAHFLIFRRLSVVEHGLEVRKSLEEFRVFFQFSSEKALTSHFI